MMGNNGSRMVLGKPSDIDGVEDAETQRHLEGAQVDGIEIETLAH
jgi:hypothetical protein